MAVFRFRLAQVLRLQQAVEDMEKRELQQKLSNLAQAKTRLVEAQTERERFAEDLQQTVKAGTAADQLVVLLRWHPVLAEAEAEKKLAAVWAEGEANRQREQLKLASIEKRILERLEEQQQNKHSLTIAREEQVAFDELAVQGWPSGGRL